MGVFGDKLRREREMRGITLEEIAESTKISKRWLKALEDEEFEVLPGGVFNRGFVRAYARFLGINEEQAVADYVAARNEPKPPEDKFPLDVHQKKSDSPPLNPKRSFLPVVLAIVALILVVGGWAYWIKHKPTQPRLADQHPRQQTSPAVAVNDASPQPAANQATSLAPSKSTDAVAVPSQTDGAAGDEQKKPSSDTEGDVEARPDQNLTNSFTVVVKAKQNSWISIVADGRPLWEGTLSANSERSVQAGRELVLKTGNAAGIDVSYNGKLLGVLGKEKEVRTIAFNTAGLQQ